MKEKEEIKVKVTLTPGFEKRFTEACLEVIRKMDSAKSEIMKVG